MPRVPEEELVSGGFVAGIQPTQKQETSFIDDLVPAAFRLENTLGSFSNRDTDTPLTLSPVTDADFDPLDEVPRGFELYADRYKSVASRAEMTHVTERISRELEDKELLASSGLSGMAAGFVAGVVDPINLLPVGGAAYRAARLGSNILEGGLVTARAGFLGMTAQESALQMTQETRTFGESATNIAVGTFLSGVLGGAVGAVPVVRGDFDTKALIEQVERDLTLPDSTGAMSARATLEEEGLAGNKAFNAALRAVRFQDPLLRMQTSVSTAARRLIQDLAETPLALEKNRRGVATELSVERQVRNWNGHLVRSLRSIDDAYGDYIGKSGPMAVTRGSLGARMSGDRLTYGQFKEEVAKAMRRGDEHDIPQVAATAKHLRATLYEPLRDAAVKAGLLDESVDVTTAVSYLNRVYDTDAMVAKREEFLATTSDWLRRRSMEAEHRLSVYAAERAPLVKKVNDLQSKMEARYTKEGKAEVLEELRAAQKQLKDLEAQHRKDRSDVEMDDLDRRDVAEQIYSRILSTPAGRLPYDMTVPKTRRGRRGQNDPDLSAPFKTRAFLIEDELIEPFLVNDVESLSKALVRNMAPDIELAKRFDGDLSMTQALKDIDDEYSKLMNAAKSAKERAKLEKRKNADIRDAMAVRDRIRGVYGMPADPTALAVRTGRAVRHLNYVRMLGEMVVSAVPDLARVGMVHGFTNNFRDVLVPMMRNFSRVKLAARELRDLGLASDMILNSRMQAFANISDDFGRNSKFERALGGMADTFGMVSLMAPWNQALKSLAGITSMQRLRRAMLADVRGTISKKELEYLRSASITVDDSRAILAQLDRHGGDEDGLFLANTSAWDDGVALTKFQSAVGRDIDRTILTPGQDVPLMSTKGELGKMIFQFKSFALAATQRMLLSGLQQRDMAVVNGLMLSTALGMVSYWAKQNNAGRETSDDVRVWIKEGVDRSGVLGWFFEANNMLEKATRGHVGVSPLLGGEPMSRYASRNVAGALLGPTFGTVQSMAGVVGGASAAAFGDEPIHQDDLHALRRLLPYSNLFYFRRLMDHMEQGLGESIGLRQ